MLRAALEVCQGEIEAKKLEVSLALRAEVHHVWADPARLQQVFWNLIKNAVKFTPAGGRISLRSADAGAGRMAIEVADTGVGIEPEVLPRIFDAFEQGDHVRHATVRRPGPRPGDRQDAGGAARRDADGHQRGPGPRVGLPGGAGDDRPAEGSRASPAGPASPADGPPKLLLVEDNADTLRAIASLLRSSGFAVRTAGSVGEALAALDVERFDLLVSDIGLPDGSGLDIMRHGRDQLRAEGDRLQRLRDRRATCARAWRPGSAHHLAKPASLDLLVALIGRTAA